MAAAIPLARFHARVRSWMERESTSDEIWAVAVSGGADSVALLLLLWAHFPQRRKKLWVLHYDHGLRPDSAADALFVGRLAKELAVDFATARRALGGTINEDALRKSRLQFFQEQLAARAARVIFFSLFLAFGYSTIPLMVKIVLAGQVKMGNSDVALVRAARAWETRIIVVFWILITLGLAIAVPAAIHDGFFDVDPAASGTPAKQKGAE